MSKFETRFSGRQWGCDGCGKKIMTETLLVLELEITAHLAECVPKLKKKLQDEAAANAQGDLFGKS